MIRILLGHKDALWRGALAAVLSKEEDLQVVAELAGSDEVLAVTRQERPHLVVLDVALPGSLTTEELCSRLNSVLPECGVLLLLGRPLFTDLASTVARLAPRVGVVAVNVSPSQLVEAVRQVAHGKPVIDNGLAVAAMTGGDNPLTGREREVLRRALGGAPAKDIAAELYLSPGTVRNYLSRVVSKTGARTRIEAIRIAQHSGWI
ncbi:MAG TPA: response regulator transcription factor [Mycobacteriales bacterium]|nr:response regulator transcription factor [Mycobacteriales bacterium]